MAQSHFQAHPKSRDWLVYIPLYPLQIPNITPID